MCHKRDVCTIRQTDVMIIGSGCAAWWVSLFLTLLGIASVILDTNQPGAFASTGNQGWLQAGGLYMLAGNDFLTAQACRDGFRWIARLYPEVIRPNIPCYFLLPEEVDPEDCLKLCQQVDVHARLVSLADLKVREPILSEHLRGYVLQTSDAPVDTRKLLQILAGQACRMGVHFQVVRSLATINPTWDGEQWCVALEQEQEIQARSVVLACGAAIPEMLQRCIPSVAPAFELTKIPVMVLHGEVASSMLISLHAPASPHLVPFHGAEGNGASVCLFRTDEKISDYRDMALSEGVLERYQKSFSGFYDGLAMSIKKGGDIPIHVYMCQKVHLVSNPYSRAAMCLPYAPESGGPENLFVFYPGKFTAAPVAARACAEAVEKCLGGRRVGHTRAGEATPVPTIARQRYYSNPEYMLAVRHDELAFYAVK